VAEQGPKSLNLLISVERGLLLRIEAAAILLGIGRTTMYELIGRGRIPVVRIGRRTLVHRSDLERFAHEQRHPPPDAGETTA
jgi:excisionase family DNA binding protein